MLNSIFICNSSKLNLYWNEKPTYWYGTLESEIFSTRLHHEGRINWEKCVSYENGEVDYVDTCNAECKSIHELNNMVQKVGYPNVAILYYYLEPIVDMRTGLRELSTDTYVRASCDWAYNFKVMEVYCHHLTVIEIEELNNNLIIESPNEGKNKSGVVIEELDEQECITKEPYPNLRNTRTNSIVGPVGGQKGAECSH